MRVLFELILILLDIFWWIMLVMIIMSWLISFNVINTRNQFVAQLWRALNQLTDPVLRPIRRRLPNMSGLDLSPLIVFLGIWLIQRVIVLYILPRVPF